MGPGGKRGKGQHFLPLARTETLRSMATRTDSNRELQLLTLPSAARRAGVGLRQLRVARDRGELAVYRVGAWDRVRWADVLGWLERCRTPAHVRGARK